jgi:hypothetical protein
MVFLLPKTREILDSSVVGDRALDELRLLRRDDAVDEPVATFAEEAFGRDAAQENEVSSEVSLSKCVGCVIGVFRGGNHQRAS